MTNTAHGQSPIERVNRISRLMDIETNPHKRMAYRMVIKRLIERMEG